MENLNGFLFSETNCRNFSQIFLKVIHSPYYYYYEFLFIIYMYIKKNK